MASNWDYFTDYIDPRNLEQSWDRTITGVGDTLNLGTYGEGLADVSNPFHLDNYSGKGFVDHLSGAKGDEEMLEAAKKALKGACVKLPGTPTIRVIPLN